MKTNENVLYIHVPDLEDSFSRIVLEGRSYLIRFTYNGARDRWSFGLYNMQKAPIAIGLPIVPQFPLNMQIVHGDFPPGVFGVYSDLEHVGRDDFLAGRARFAYMPNDREDVSDGAVRT